MKKWMLALLLLCLMIPCLALADEAQVASVDATSWIVGKDPDAWIPERMIDGDETTPYQFSLKTTPLGKQFLTFYLGWVSDIDALWIKNGFWRVTDGLDQYVRNCRVKKMTAEFLYEGASGFADAQTITLPDDKTRADWTRISLGERNRVAAVRLRIDDIYTGSKFKNDVCISEIKFVKGSAAVYDLYGLAKQKIATRNGPGTQYDEKGTYNVAGQYLRVFSRAWDSRNGIWWVKCEIPYKGEKRVLWTGYKRFDSDTLPLESIPVEGEDPNAGKSGGQAQPVQGWRDVYRAFVRNQQYEKYLRCVEPAFQDSFYDPAQRTNTFALYDLDRDGVPELITESLYGLEQYDVFTCEGSAVRWLGTAGGDNFINDVFRFDDPRYPGLFVSLGGPAQTVQRCTLSGGAMTKQTVGATVMNAEGDEATDFRMDVQDSGLYILLFNRLVAWPSAGGASLVWFGWTELLNDAGWVSFCASAG